MIYIDTRSSIPIYEQIYSSITRLALAGGVSPHDKLPSVRQIAKDFGINPNTVSKAYTLLETEGIIYSVPGRGCFVAEDAKTSQKLKKDLLAKFETLVTECRKTLIEEHELITLVSDVYGKNNKQEEL